MNESLKSLSRSDEVADRRNPVPAWVIPAGILAGFGLLFLVLFGDRLLPATEVQVAPVMVTPDMGPAAPETSTASPPADAPMAFQASGWVEPDPLPIKATALVDGVVDQVHVLEGEPVEAGQELATLIQDDARLALKAARESLRMSRAELAAHLESIEAAKNRISAARAQVEAAEALVDETDDRVRRIEGLAKGTISDSERVTIRAAHLKALAGEAAGRAAVGQAEAEVKSQQARTAVLESAVRNAEVKVEQAELAFSRTTIASPVDGRVLRLNAAPGQKKMLGMDDPDSATIAILYDPQRLQVRVDVPLADAAGLQIGQRARVRCSLLPETIFHGEVTRITGEADIQRNTLQAKVRIDDPSDQLRPEMLCRVEFLTVAPGGGTVPGGMGSLATWIPEAALAGGTVWVCDPETGRVERREVEPGDARKDGFLRVDRGLRPGEWAVLSPSGLDDGQRVNPELIQP